MCTINVNCLSTSAAASMTGGGNSNNNNNNNNMLANFAKMFPQFSEYIEILMLSVLSAVQFPLYCIYLIGFCMLVDAPHTLQGNLKLSVKL